jgi:hypothetical protein
MADIASTYPKVQIDLPVKPASLDSLHDSVAQHSASYCDHTGSNGASPDAIRGVSA